MPPKKRKPISQRQPKAKAMKQLRRNETEEQTSQRLAMNRERTETARAMETDEEYEVRLRNMRERASTSRADETEEQRDHRLENMRERANTSRADETEEQRDHRLENMRERANTSRADETEEQRDHRLENMRERANTSRADETEEQRDHRLENMRQNERTRRVAPHLMLEMEGFRYDPQKDYSHLPTVIIGGLNKTCSYCSAKKFKSEPLGMCCSKGKVKLPRLDPPPNDLIKYMSGDSAESNHFLKNIRKYNACFQMTSFGATGVIVNPGFPTTFTVQGQVYHKLGSLLPNPGQSSKYLQIYFMGDSEIEVDQRCNIIPGTRRDIVLDLQHMLHEYNHLVRGFKTAMEQMPTDDYKVVIRADRTPTGEHERRFNAPQVNEVAVIMSVDDCDRRDIIIHRRGDVLQRICETHRSYDALQYPLLFPYGEDGYHFGMHQINPATEEATNKKVSAMDFYASRIMIRDQQNHILNSRHLYHQFVVDMYAKIESERLLYIRLNQNKLRAEEYIHLRDAVVNDGNVQNVGALVILPSSFTGSPRHMHEYTQDAMTYVRNYGRPDLFVTFTCNSNWREIKDLLTNGQSSSDRHDLIARVFRQKQIKLMAVINKSHIFGPSRCWMYTIEYQKRGLPHSHNLIWFREKIHTNQIDEVISAEIPDKVADPGLHAIVLKHMIHGPCGTLNPSSPCMKDKKCTKRYPRPLLAETQTGEDSYPQYRRRAPEDGGFTAKIKIRGGIEIEIDNSWVVPYSPILLKMFEAHINVEYCNTVRSIKYVCKYVNKGSDMAVFTVSVENENDEITLYQLGRYISTSEAIWRILGFPIHERYPAVVHLSVHLENGQRVYFTEENVHRVAESPPNTTLTAFFQLNEQDPFARTLLYHEIPKYYTWNTSRKVFSRRKIGRHVAGQDAVESDALGRVYTVHPNNAECFFLRMLLHTVRGPTSFSALRTVEGEECQTYRETCQKLGLLEDDQHWDSTMAEAQLISMPEQIRNLFAIILTTCSPSNPAELWAKYRESMSEDILARVRSENPTLEISFSPDIFNRGLILLEDKCLAMVGKTLTELGLPSPMRDEHDHFEAEMLRELEYNVPDLEAHVSENEPKLNLDQRVAYEIIMSHLRNNQGGILFLDAPGGTGKTFLTNLVLAKVRANRSVALAIASSGIAATLMDGGRTAHSALKLPLDIARQENPTCRISKNSGRAQVLRACKLIVWDECTMAHKKSLEALNTTLKDLRGNDNIMGGTLVVLCGDFRQTLPVIPKSTPADEIYACLKHSSLWRNVKRLCLKENMRITSNNREGNFAGQLLALGEGRLPLDASGNIQFPRNFCTLKDSVEELIEAVYPDIVSNFSSSSWLRERAILAAKNDIVNVTNNSILNKLPGAVTEYRSIDTMVETDEIVNYPAEFLNSLDPPGLPPHLLKLKVGCPIILLRNLDPPKLCNGTRLCVKKTLPHVIEATVLTGKGKGETAFIPRIPLIPTDLPFDFKRLQLPVRLAFAITINKAQGQSIKCCGVNLESPCFSHGQLYVACSRVGGAQDLHIYAPGGVTKNIVYQQVLQ